MSRITILHNSDKIGRMGTISDVMQERKAFLLPKALQAFIPAEIEVSEEAGQCIRYERLMGPMVSDPVEMVQRWWDARTDMWKARPIEEKTLLQWLKSLTPHFKMDILDFLRRAKGQDGLPSKKQLEKLLQIPLKIQLFEGPIHGALTARRIREHGFICWRHATLNGLRGQDIAPYLEDPNFPLDVQLHILKWSWKWDVAKALRILSRLEPLHKGEQQPATDVFVQHIQHHPALSHKQVCTILNCEEGTSDISTIRRALYRAKKLPLGGQEIQIETTVPLTPHKDPAFFLVRNRDNQQLFSKWSEIQSDEEGRYSLTPETHALSIAQEVTRRHTKIYDAFCGLGGNTIAFARCASKKTNCSVISNEWDKARLKMARHNAQLYGVHAQIQWHNQDALHFYPAADFVFLDPPWSWSFEQIEELRLEYQKHYTCGMLKIPVTFPIPSGMKAKIYCTIDNFPSFMVLQWSSLS